MPRRSRPKVNVPHALLDAVLHDGGDLPHLLRVWALLRALDPDGTGYLRREAAVAGLRALGLGKSAANAWVNAVVASPFARLSATTFGDPVVKLASIEDLLVAYAGGRSGLDVRVPVGPLLRRSYRRHLLNGARAPHGRRPMARAAVAAEYGRSPNTQRRDERDAGVRPQENLVALDTSEGIPTDDATSRWHPSVFSWGGVVWQRLPNTTSFPDFEVVRRRRRHCPAKVTGLATHAAHPRRYHLDGERASRRRVGWAPPAGRAGAVGPASSLAQRPWPVWMAGRWVSTWEPVA